MVDRVHFSSERADWATPLYIMGIITELFGPRDLDVCAVSGNNKCDCFISPREDAFKITWPKKNAFCNPPYGRGLTPSWVKLCAEKAWSEEILDIVCLLPARTDTKYWHRYCMHAQTIVFFEGRVRFLGGVHTAPFPSCLVHFTQTPQEMPAVLAKNIRGYTK